MSSLVEMCLRGPFAPAAGMLALFLLAACTPSAGADTSVNTSINTEAGRDSNPAYQRRLDPQRAGYYALGKTASAEEIAGWDIDVNAEGEGLPPGSGSVEDGESLYEDQCSECHGSFGEGVGRFPKLAGGEGSLKEARPLKTIGSYWEYSATIWDYIHRAMPFVHPESLSDDEVYALTAYVLYLNDLVDDDFVLDQNNLTSIRLPNEGNFFPDPRPDTHNTRCMQDCKDPSGVKIVSEAAATDDSGNPISAVDAARADSSTGETTTLEMKPLSEGEKIYTDYCDICHAVGAGGAPIVGDPSAWNSRIAKGTDTLVRHALEGVTGEAGVMPPKGGFANLSDAEVTAAVHHMMEAVK